MKNKLMKTLVVGILLSATGLASAEPIALTDNQMDSVSAGGLLGLDSLLGGVVGTAGGLVTPVVGTVGGLVTPVLGTVQGLIPSVNLQAGAAVSAGAALGLSL